MRDVSIILIVKNESKFINNSIKSILNQSFNNFEIIIVDDNSSDNTVGIIKSFNDERIKLFITNNMSGYGNLRNFALDKSSGKYVFFTDADCFVHYNWVSEALKKMKNENIVGVEGKTFYESRSAVSVSDYFTYRTIPGGYMTCNVAYSKEAILLAGCFDSKFQYVYEDRDLGVRIKKIGAIYFEPNMLVFHQQKKLTIKNLFIRSKRAADMVYFDYKHGRKQSEYIRYNILYPSHLLIILFPPLIFLGSRIETFKDLIFTFFKYFSFLYERILIWKNSIKYKKLII